MHIYVLVFSHKTMTAGPPFSAGAVLLFKVLAKLLYLSISHQLMVDLVRMHRCIIIIIAHVLCICAWSMYMCSSVTSPRREVNLALSVSSKRTLSLLYTATCFPTPVTCCCRAPRHALSTCQVQRSFLGVLSNTLTHAK